MRRWLLLSGMVVIPAVALGGCGRGSVLRDWSLHREWRIACDIEHPDRPATLMEVPWTTPEPAADVRLQPHGAPAPMPDVRSGMRVTLWRRQESADLRLSGIALGTARRGERVKVRAGMGVSILDGIVRGPALVELTPEEERR